jgi:hypothetical protein
MSNIFGDFKRYHFDSVINRFRKLKNIFDRLDLFDFEKKLTSLTGKVDDLTKIVTLLPDILKKPVTTGTFVIFHAHNPEDKEIGQFGVQVAPQLSFLSELIPLGFAENAFLTIEGEEAPIPGARVLSEHNALYPVHAGLHHCIAKFNNITVDLGYHQFNEGETTTITVVFPRQEYSLDWVFNDSASVSGSWDFHDFTSGFNSAVGQIQTDPSFPYESVVSGSFSTPILSRPDVGKDIITYSATVNVDFNASFYRAAHVATIEANTEFGTPYSAGASSSVIPGSGIAQLIAELPKYIHLQIGLFSQR